MQVPTVAEGILLLAPTLLVPAGRRIANKALFGNDAGRIEGMIDRCQLPSAILLVVAFLIPQGTLPAALATPWVIVTLMIAVSGIRRLRGFRSVGSSTFAAAAGHVFLAVGGLWTWLSRAGMRPMEFSDEIVLLTGIHFHYAGFVLPVILGVIADHCRGRVMPTLVLGIVAGIPLVGIGIALSPVIEVVAAIWLSACCLILAGFQIRIAVRAADIATVWLLISSVSLAAAMILASVYAVGEYFGQGRLTIAMMIATHGLANSLGFAGCGIWGWRLRLDRVAQD